MSAVASLSPFLSALSLHWGYTSFRPGQEEIAASIAVNPFVVAELVLVIVSPVRNRK